MQVDNSVVEGGCAGRQVKIPHAEEVFIKHFSFFIQIISEILFPVKQGFIIMQTEIFDVQSVEIIFSHMIEDLTQTWNSSTRENVFLDPWVTRMFFQGADEMKKE